MSQHSARSLVGGFVTMIAGIAIGILSPFFFFGQYTTILSGFFEAGKPPGTVLQSYLQPVFAEILMVAAVFLIVSGLGFFYNRKWAFIVGVIGSVIGLWGGWMLAMFPLMVALPPFQMSTFVLSAIVFFTLIVYVNKTELKVWLTSFVFGMAFVMTFMNGTASLNKMIGVGLKARNSAPNSPHVSMIKMNGNDGLIFEFVQQFLYIGALGFAIICVAVLFRQNWVLPVGFGAGLIGVVGGIPVAYLDSVDQSHVSQFFYGPGLAVIVLLALFIFKEKLWAKDTPLFSKKNAKNVSTEA